MASITTDADIPARPRAAASMLKPATGHPTMASAQAFVRDSSYYQEGH